MRRILILMVVLAMAALPLAGCCTRVDPVTKVSTKTFGNCVAAAQDILCNPTDQQKAAAAAALAFITSGISIASLVVNVPITPAEVQLVFGAVQGGGCVLAADMMKALAWYAAVTADLQNQAVAGKAAGLKAVAAMPPNIDPLYNW
jgi:hypothetical protein